MKNWVATASEDGLQIIMSLKISNQVSIPFSEIQFHAIRAQGAGGQNVNKVSSAVHLRFDIAESSLPDTYKESLKKISDQRITSDGVIIIKAQRFRSQEKNRSDALDRLTDLIKLASAARRLRKPTKPTYSSQRKRVDSKTKRGQLKSGRGRVDSTSL